MSRQAIAITTAFSLLLAQAIVAMAQTITPLLILIIGGIT